MPMGRRKTKKTFRLHQLFDRAMFGPRERDERASLYLHIRATRSRNNQTSTARILGVEMAKPGALNGATLLRNKRIPRNPWRGKFVSLSISLYSKRGADKVSLLAE